MWDNLAKNVGKFFQGLGSAVVGLVEHSIGNAIAVLGIFGFAFSCKTKNDLGKIVTSITAGSGVSLSVAGLSDIAEGIENMWNGITGNHDKDAGNAIKDKLFGGDTASYTAAKLLIISLGGSSALTIYDILTKQPILGIVGGSGAKPSLSNNDVQHIKKHSFEGMQEQAKHLTDSQLQVKLDGNTFFNKNWSMNDIANYSSQAYDSLISQGLTNGTYQITINNEIINVVIKDGVFKTAYGNYVYTIDYFR